jgi:integration host factor subunit alpha
VTKNDLINAIAAHGLSKRQSASVVETVFDIIFRCFEKSEDVKIVGFGHFRIRHKASRRGRNPQTGDSIEITARKVLTFKPSKGLKQRINAYRASLARPEARTDDAASSAAPASS